MVLTLSADRGTIKLAPTLKFRAGVPPSPRFYRWEDGRLIETDRAEPRPNRASTRTQLEGEILTAISVGSSTRTDIACQVGRRPEDGTFRRALQGLKGQGLVERLDDGSYVCQLAD